MSDGDASLSQALSQLTEADDLNTSEEVQEVARVRKARANVTEHARKTGDNAESLISSLVGDSDAELTAEINERKRLETEKVERMKAEKEAEEARKRAEAQAKLDEEKRKLEEKEQRRLQMLAELEKKRKLEAGEVDEEEEARKKAEADAEAARIAAKKAREEAEEAALNSDNAALAEQIQALKLEKAAREEAAQKAAKKRNVSLIALIGGGIATIVIIVFALYSAQSAPDYYLATDSYKTIELTPENHGITIFDEPALAFNEVKQRAPKTASKSRKASGPTDKYGIGSAKDVLGGSGKIVK